MEKRFISLPQRESNLGFVLPTTILMLVLFSSLILTLWQQVLQFSKLYNLVKKEHETLQNLENAAKKIKQLYENPICIIENPDAAIWELHHSKCHMVINQNEYVYNFAKLANYPCLQVKSQKKWYGTQHWLLTLQMFHQPETVLQIRLALPLQGLVCTGKQKILKKTLLNWRYLKLGNTDRSALSSCV